MELDAIMGKIRDGLTGDTERDIRYLEKCAEMYRTHPLHLEIARACGRMITQMLPEDVQKETERLSQQAIEEMEGKVEQANFLQYQKKYQEALEMLEPVVKDVDETSFLKDDSVSEYHTFREPLQFLLYDFLYGNEKKTRCCALPYDKVYFSYGSLLIDCHRVQEAQQALKKAVQWNPLSEEIYFEYVETYKMLGDLETFHRETMKAFSWLYTPEGMARAYRNIGYYFVEKGEYRTAADCYFLSMHYEKSKQAQSELFYIFKTAGVKFEAPDCTRLKECARKNHLPLGYNQEVIAILYAAVEHFQEEKDEESEKYYKEYLDCMIEDQVQWME